MDNQPTIETYEFSVPYQVCGRIIGRNGNTIQQIQRFSGAEIVIEKDLTNISQSMYYFNFFSSIFLFR